MQIVRKKLFDLQIPDRNVRKHDERQIREFMRSVEMFGQIRPIVIDEHGLILCGNGLYETMRRMGREEADCLIAERLTDRQKKKLMIADNRVFSLGIDDQEVLDAFIQELQDDLDIPGIGEEDLSVLFSGMDEELDTLPREESDPYTRHQPPEGRSVQVINGCREVGPGEFSSEHFRYRCPRCQFLFND